MMSRARERQVLYVFIRLAINALRTSKSLNRVNNVTSECLTKPQTVPVRLQSFCCRSTLVGIDYLMLGCITNNSENFDFWSNQSFVLSLIWQLSLCGMMEVHFFNSSNGTDRMALSTLGERGYRPYSRNWSERRQLYSKFPSVFPN